MTILYQKLGTAYHRIGIWPICNANFILVMNLFTESPIKRFNDATDPHCWECCLSRVVYTLDSTDLLRCTTRHLWNHCLQYQLLMQIEKWSILLLELRFVVLQESWPKFFTWSYILRKIHTFFTIFFIPTKKLKFSKVSRKIWNIKIKITNIHQCILGL